MDPGAIVGLVFGILFLILILVVTVLILHKRKLLPIPGYLTEQSPMHFTNPVYTQENETVDFEGGQMYDPSQIGIDNPVYEFDPSSDGVVGFPAVPVGSRGSTQVGDGFDNPAYGSDPSGMDTLGDDTEA